MTAAEFNEKYKDYLEEGHYGLDMHEEVVVDYLDLLFEELIKIPDFKYSQIKWKFGRARFYSMLEWRLSALIEDKLNQLNSHAE